MLAAEAQGYRIEKSASQVGGGPLIVTISAYGTTGALAYQITSSTNATGTASTITYDDNGDGVIDRIQSITKFTNPDASKTTTITTKNGGVDTAAITTDVEQTTVSADNKVITINRDGRGGGWFNQL
jgi:hypothetical protein